MSRKTLERWTDELKYFSVDFVSLLNAYKIQSDLQSKFTEEKK